MKRIIKDPTYSVYSKGGNVVNDLLRRSLKGDK
jgi:hypothetical protein